MRRQQLIVTLIAVIAVIGLYQLPKVVVDNDETDSFTTVETEQDISVHKIEIPDSVYAQIDLLRDQFLSSDSKEKSLIFADSLARAFLVYSELDSVSRYANQMAQLASSNDEIELTGDFYFTAFNMSLEEVSRKSFAERARELYGQIISANDRPDLEMRIAMTLVASDNPMEGILKLRELVEKYPESVEGQYNLGLLSIRSAQYDRAIDRFKKVIELDPQNIEGYFYLGVSYMEQGETEKAKEYLNHVALEGKDPAIQKLVEDYLNEIN